MGSGNLRAWTASVAAIFVMGTLFLGVGEVRADQFDQYLAHVDDGLRNNPNHVGPQALASCMDRRNHASWVASRGDSVRAVRSLKYCFSLLGLSEADVAKPPDPQEVERKQVAALNALRTNAKKESTTANTLNADLINGLEIYRECAACHMPEGWGMLSGIVPNLAGQHGSVIIKQLADIRAGYRKNQVMAPYASVESIGGAQAVADVAAYIDTLEMTTDNGKGPGDHLSLGEKLYRGNCVNCHGDRGQGNPEKEIPRIQSQHYGYLVTQFELIRDGDRRNANPEMVQQIQGFEQREVEAVLDYVSRLEPPKEMQAPPGWRNPDFMLPRARR